MYTNSITRLRIGDQFTRALSLRAIVQVTTLDVDIAQTTLRLSRNVNYDVLFTCLRAPGTAIYIGGNYNVAALDPLRSATLANDEWQVFAKMSYLVRR